MNALITVGTFLVVVAGAGLVFWRVTRRPDEEHPKRRELRRANVRVIAAQRAMCDIEAVIAQYRPTLDVMESAMSNELERVIREYKTKDLETEK